MRFYITLILPLLFFAANTSAQSNDGAEKLVETERAFAAAAETKGIKTAFLEFLADDAVMFNPQQTNGREMWQARPDSPALLAWYPTFADISSNGVLGYTTGEGAYRPKGKTDNSVFYSTYATFWRRQPDGNYKAAFDIGVSHDKPTVEDKSWKSPKIISEKIDAENKPPAANAMSQFYDQAATKGLSKAYKTFAAEDARFLREGKFPILGKSNAPETKKSAIKFGTGATMQSAGDLGYSITTYEIKSGDKITEKGSIVQIWKLVGGRWQIVLDAFAPIPLDKK